MTDKTFTLAAPSSLSIPLQSSQQIAAAYLKEAVLSASPAELTLMSYDGIIRFLKRAEVLLDAQPTEYKEKMANIAELNEVIGKAQALISDLESSLNESAGQTEEENRRVRALVASLRSQYLYLNRHLSFTLSRRNPLMIRQALVIVQNFRDGWAGAMEKMRTEQQ